MARHATPKGPQAQAPGGLAREGGRRAGGIGSATGSSQAGGSGQKPGSSKQPEGEEREKKRRLLIIILLLIAFASLALCAWLLLRTPELAPDYAPQEIDPNAFAIEDVEDKLDEPEGGGAVGLTYTPEVTIDLSEKSATLMFQNPHRSNDDVLLQIVVQDEVLAQSGRIEPGMQISTLELLPGAAEMLSPGGYDAHFTVLFYDAETAERSVLKSEAAISLTVVA